MAFNDIDDATEYFHNISPTLSKRFLSQIRKSIKTLSQNPFFQIRYKDYRCLHLKHFPYMFHYLIDEKSKTSVLAFLLSARDSYHRPSLLLLPHPLPPCVGQLGSQLHNPSQHYIRCAIMSDPAGIVPTMIWAAKL